MDSKVLSVLFDCMYVPYVFKGRILGEMNKFVLQQRVHHLQLNECVIEMYVITYHGESVQL